MNISTQAAFRALRSLPFCYLCGATIDPGTGDREHVLARSLFAKADRTPPLILPSHAHCNRERSGPDEAIGQLVSLLHGLRLPSLKRLAVLPRLAPSGALTVATPFDLRGCIWRWVRGYHAALYREYLPDVVDRAIFPPLPSIPTDSGTSLLSDDRLQQLGAIVRLIKQSRVAQRTDTVVSHSGRCRYDCVWTRFDNGSWTCFFALRIYNWEVLGDTSVHPRRGCAGAYGPFDSPPMNAARAPEVPIAISNHAPLDPFGP